MGEENKGKDRKCTSEQGCLAWVIALYGCELQRHPFLLIHISSPFSLLSFPLSSQPDNSMKFPQTACFVPNSAPSYYGIFLLLASSQEEEVICLKLPSSLTYAQQNIRYAYIGLQVLICSLFPPLIPLSFTSQDSASCNQLESRESYMLSKMYEQKNSSLVSPT